MSNNEITIEQITGKYHDRWTLIDAVTTFADLGKTQIWIASRCRVSRAEVYSIIHEHRSGALAPVRIGQETAKETVKAPALNEVIRKLKGATMQKLIDATAQWHRDRNLIDGSTDQAQFVKLMEEAGELAHSIGKKKDPKDDIGDMLVVLVNIAERNGLTLTTCLAHAYDEIKDRKGKLVDGIFVKESDL
jgi:NTP pyrophosphatase (non-canonical NTP hydrolase)